MKVETRFVANDGSEWKEEIQCLLRDRMISEVNEAMMELKPTPTECNWKGFIQQDPRAVLRCKSRLYDIANKEGVLKWWIDGQKQNHGKTDKDLIVDTHPSWFGRMLDGGHAPLSNAYSRLCAIDSGCREWNQPYYAANPGTGEPVCVG